MSVCYLPPKVKSSLALTAGADAWHRFKSQGVICKLFPALPKSGSINAGTGGDRVTSNITDSTSTHTIRVIEVFNPLTSRLSPSSSACLLPFLSRYSFFWVSDFTVIPPLKKHPYISAFADLTVMFPRPLAFNLSLPTVQAVRFYCIYLNNKLHSTLVRCQRRPGWLTSPRYPDKQ